MNIFESPFSKNTCGSLDIPDGSSGGIQLMLLDKQNKSCNVKFLHTSKTTVEGGGTFTTVSEKVSCDLSVNKFVLYLNESSSYSWILENSITINIYNFRNNKLLATKVLGKQDSLVRLGISQYKDKPSIVLTKCDPDIDFDLDDNFVKVEIVSMCDGNASPCCDSLPTQVAVSGYSTVCIPLQDFYSVPSYPEPTTTQSPYTPPATTVSLLDDLSIKQSSGIPYYVVDGYVSTSDGSDFSYWWERSEDNINWYRITDLKTEQSETLLAIKEVKERDYYYRLYFASPQSRRSNTAFFDYPDVTTTTTTTTTAAPLKHPDTPLNLQASGGGFRQVHLDWSHAAVNDERAPRTGYSVFANTSASTDSYDTFIFGTSLAASTTGYFQPVPAAYDGIELHYCLYSENFFGRSDPTCAAATTVSNEPPTVSNLVVTPDDTGGIEGFFLDWVTTGANETYPLVSHRIQYRTSGTADAYSVINYPVAQLSETEVKVTGLFDNCEQIEFLVDVESTIGFSTVPATGYGLYGFLPHSPTNLSLALEDAGGGNVNIDLGWTEPTDSGRCDVTGYVYNYRLAGTLDWSVDVPLSVTGVTPDITPVTTNPNTFSIQTNAVASGDYEVRVAAITVVGTGTYGAVGAATLIKLDFEEWVENTGVSSYYYKYHISNQSLYNNWVDISAFGGDDDHYFYGREQGNKYGTYGFYGSNLGSTCPVEYATATNYPAKFFAMHWDGYSSTNGSPPPASNNTEISLTNSATRLNTEYDGETRSTLECWFKLNGFSSTWNDFNIPIIGYAAAPQAVVLQSQFPVLASNLESDNAGIDLDGSNYLWRSIAGDFISGSGLRLKIRSETSLYLSDTNADEANIYDYAPDPVAPHPNYINDEEWHHVALVSSGNNLRLFVDGTGVIDYDITYDVDIYYADGNSFSVNNTGMNVTHRLGILTGSIEPWEYMFYLEGDVYEDDINAYCLFLDEIRLTKTVAYSGDFDVPTERLI